MPPKRALFKPLDYSVRSLENGKALFYVPYRRHSFVLPETMDKLLARCDRFKTLAEHAEAVGALLSLPAAPTRALRDSLDWLARQGLLISHADMVAAIVGAGRHRSPKARLEHLGIPTADRTPLLARALGSYAENAERHRRALTLLVVDDSRGRAARLANRAVVGTVAKRSPGCRILYVGHRDRVRIARRLCRVTGIDREVVEFALLASKRYGVTTGAARNVLLLLTAGRLSLQADDDTVAQIHCPPDYPGDHVAACSSAYDPMRFYFDTEDGIRERGGADADVAGWHERRLGRPVSACFVDGGISEWRLDDARSSFLEKLSDTSTVRTTSLGMHGDLGGSAIGPLLLTAPLSSLTRSPAVYRTVVSRRLLMQVAPCLTLSDSDYCNAMNLGLDGTALLPPFFPVLRNQDGIFGALLQRSGAHVAFLPGAIAHLPPPRTRPVAAISMGTLPFQAGHHLAHLVLGAPFTGGTMHDGLRATGAYLSDVITASRHLFEQTVREQATQALVDRIHVTRERLAEGRGQRPHPYWTHLKGVARRLDRALRWQHVPVVDLENAGISAPMDDLRRLTALFGRLLTAWPELISAASRIDMLDLVGRPGQD
jgi:hypothetical protein